MKILITLLLALFISGQAYSKGEGTYKTCLYLDSQMDRNISSLSGYKIFMDQELNKKNDISKERIRILEETRDRIYADLMRDSTIWQKLSCTELLK